MAKIALQIDDPTNRLALRALLETEGHRVVGAEPDLVIADTPQRALLSVEKVPALTLASAAMIPEAVESMRRGVYGYIFLPLQPGEAVLMARRALKNRIAAAQSPPQNEWLTLEEAEMQHILDTLRRCKHNQAQAARILGIGRNTLWRKLKKAGLLDENQTEPPGR